MGTDRLRPSLNNFKMPRLDWGSRQVKVVAPQQVSSFRSKQGFDRRRESEKERRMASEDEKRRSIWDLGQSGWSVLGHREITTDLTPKRKLEIN